jgi:hypothetical protein
MVMRGERGDMRGNINGNPIVARGSIRGARGRREEVLIC